MFDVLSFLLGLAVGATITWLYARWAMTRMLDHIQDNDRAWDEELAAAEPVATVALREDEGEVKAFDEAVDAAAAEGWVSRLPDGRHLSARLGEGDDGARAVMGALEEAAKRGVSRREDLFARQLAVERVWRAAEGLADAHGLELRVEAPRAVGPRHQEHWIIDEDLARQVGSSSDSGFVQPVLVLRPALLREGRVLLEGVVV